MTQSHYPRKSFAIFEWLPSFFPYVIRLYDISIRIARQVAPQSSDDGDRHQAHADGTVEGVSAPLRRPTRPSGARAHRAGVPAPALDGSSGRDLRVGFPADGRALLATTRWATVRREVAR